MRRNQHLALLTLLATLCAASCSKPPAPSKPRETPAATPQPQEPKPQAPAGAADHNIDQAISTNVGDPAKFRDFMTTLQQAVQNHDASTVATLISYPIDINPHTKQLLRIPKPEAFVAHYDSIITTHIAEVIANQKYTSLFVNYQGAMLGNGEVWIAGICRDKTCKQTDIRIRTIQNTAGKE